MKENNMDEENRVDRESNKIRKLREGKINIPMYIADYFFNEQIEYVTCTKKIMEVKIPEGLEVGYDEEELFIELFSINLN